MGGIRRVRPEHWFVSMQLISRQQAIANGLKRYFTGKACREGHIAERWVQCCACLECKKERTRKYCAGWREKNREAHIASTKEWAKRNAAYVKQRKAEKYQKNRSEVIEKSKQYYSENRLNVIARTRAYREANADAIRAAGRKYYQENSEIRKASNHRMRAQRNKAEGRYTADDIRNLKIKQKNTCACCRIKLTAYHIDHINPLSKGGNNWPENLQLLCPSCNQRKSNKDPIEFMQLNGYLI